MKKLWNWPTAVFAAVVLAVAGAGSAAAIMFTPSPVFGQVDWKDLERKSTLTIYGTMTLLDSNLYGGYDDIHAGAQVEVLNGRNEVIAIGELEPDEYDTGNAYSFHIEGVPAGQGTYGVHIGNENRGVIWKKESEALRGLMGFDLTLGG
jgi:hypothetical protein